MSPPTLRSSRRVLAAVLLLAGASAALAATPPTPQGMRSLAELYRAQGDLAGAEMAARTSVTWLREEGHEDSAELAESLAVLAEVHADQGDLEVAAARFDEARAVNRDRAASEGWSLAARARQVQLLLRNAEVLESLGDAAAATPLRARAAEHQGELARAFKQSLRKELERSPGLDVRKARRRNRIQVYLNGVPVDAYQPDPMSR